MAHDESFEEEMENARLELLYTDDLDSALAGNEGKWPQLLSDLFHIQLEFDRSELSQFTAMMQAQRSLCRVVGREGANPYPVAEMGAPPKRLATHGRANPPGIPYLYLGSTPETATTDKRGGPTRRWSHRAEPDRTPARKGTTMTDATHQRTAFQSSHDNAVLIGALFLRLGGSLHIEANGRRARILPETPDEIPQLPDTSPHERFHSAEEWQGAMKLVDYLLTRLHPTDKTFVWDALALVATPGPGKGLSNPRRPN